MKKSNHKKFVFFILCLVIFAFQNPQKMYSQTFCTDEATEDITGVKDGFRYELWNQNSQGTACMTIDSGALFSGEWTNVLNYLARRGLSYNQTQEHQEIGSFFTTYNCDYKPSSASGNSYLSVYGWTVDPLIEFYIIEDWRNWIPSMDANATYKGTIETNGGTYKIYENTRVNQPSIVGNTTFQQYFSIRNVKRHSGTINISDHFNTWEEIGMDLGKLHEVSFVVEGYQSSGTFDFTELDIFVGDDPSLGIENTIETPDIKVYPNPSTENLIIQFNESELNARVNIYNTSGEDVFSEDTINDETLLVENLKPGIYLVSINSRKINYSTKILVH